MPRADLEALRDALDSLWQPLPHQIAPRGDWLYWLFIAGRGAGKTDAGAHYVTQHVQGPPCFADGHRVGIGAPTLGDARETCVRGVSGILSHDPGIRFVHSDGLLFWPNGSEGRIFGAYTPEDVERWRGPQHCLLWLDEFAAWRQLDECWTQARLGLRLGPHPRAIITSTPKPRKRLLELIADGHSVLTGATTDANPYLAAEVRAELYRLYGGTRMGRQELSAEILTDIEGALWKREWIDDRRREAPMLYRNGELRPDYQKVVVAVDPAVTSSAESDETGIVVVARGNDGRGYVLDDRSVRGTPLTWAKRAVQAYRDHHADHIVAESNNGGEMVSLTIATVDPNVPVRLVHASRGKRTRAEPVSAKYERGEVSHVRPLPELEDQLCNWDPDSGDSPDRLDALVWGLTELLITSTWGSGEGEAALIA